MPPRRSRPTTTAITTAAAALLASPTPRVDIWRGVERRRRERKAAAMKYAGKRFFFPDIARPVAASAAPNTP